MKKLLTLPLLGLFAFAAACSDDTSPLGLQAERDLVAGGEGDEASAPDGMTIADIVVAQVQGQDEFNQLLGAIQAADPSVLQALSSPGQYTVFAPTDDAFEALAATGALDGITQEALTDVLLYHVAQGAEGASELLAKDRIVMLSGESARIDGAAARINQANILATDIEASNGIIHVIDAVLLPTFEPRQEEVSDPTILELVEASANAEPAEFTILNAAIEAASPAIREALEAAGELTVFAPTDAAFVEALREFGVTAGELLANTELLDATLLYHVAEGEFSANALAALSQVRMLDGNRVEVDGRVLNGSADIISSDVQATNGVVHVVDKVLFLPN